MEGGRWGWGVYVRNMHRELTTVATACEKKCAREKMRNED